MTNFWKHYPLGYLGLQHPTIEKREVYTLGSKSWFMTEYEHEDIDDTKDTLVHWKELSSKDVIQIVCGVNFCACLTRSGDIYTWGNGMFGQLGIKEEVVSAFEEFKVSKPTRVESLSNCIYIAAGEECMAAITRDKHLYTWGKNFSGMLGHGDEKDVFEPKRVVGNSQSSGKKSYLDDEENDDEDEDDDEDYSDSLEKEEVIHVSCGQSHMACVTARNEVFTWGNNFLGPLGRIIDAKQEADFYPHLVELVQVGDLVTEDNLKQSDEVDFVQVECLKYNTIALTSDGRVFSCGKGGCDGGGHGEAPRTLLCIVQELEGKRVKSLAKSSFATHTGAIVVNNEEEHSKGREELYIWGNNEENKLGLPGLSDDFSVDETSLLFPKKFPFHVSRDCYFISCGETHTACILKAHPTDKNSNPSLTLEKFEKGETPQTTNTGKKEVAASSKIVEEEYDSESEGSKADSGDESDEEKPIKIEMEKPVKNTIIESDEEEEEPSPTVKPQAVNVNIDSIDGDLERENPSSHAQASSSTTPHNDTASSSKQTSKAPVKELHGYLQKKGEKGLVKLWRKRWFKLEGNNLCYYEKEGVSTTD